MVKLRCVGVDRLFGQARFVGDGLVAYIKY
jgi:hypothetical protein